MLRIPRERRQEPHGGSAMGLRAEVVPEMHANCRGTAYGTFCHRNAGVVECPVKLMTRIAPESIVKGLLMPCRMPNRSGAWRQILGPELWDCDSQRLGGLGNAMRHLIFHPGNDLAS